MAVSQVFRSNSYYLGWKVLKSSFPRFFDLFPSYFSFLSSSFSCSSYFSNLHRQNVETKVFVYFFEINIYTGIYSGWDQWATVTNGQQWDQWATLFRRFDFFRPMRPMGNTFSKSSCVAHWSHPLYHS